MDKLLVIAHRGASGYAPENTLTAIEKAIEIGADRIEVDVHQSLDDEVVVIHDPTVERTTNGEGAVLEKTYGAIKKLDAGSWFGPEFEGEKIPLLDDVFDLAKGKIDVVIELKNGSERYKNIERNTWRIVQRFNGESTTIISSTRLTTLHTFKTISPAARLAKIITPRELWRSLFHQNSFVVKQGLLKHLKELHSHWSFIDKHFMETAERHSLKVYPWTVNKERKIRAMFDRGVDGIITNFPDVALKAAKR